VPPGGTQGKREGTCERKRRKRKDKIITEAKRKIFAKRVKILAKSKGWG
jgi:hypothetical protein